MATGIIGALGVVNAGYLALTALAGVAPNCNFIRGCNLVAASPYSHIFGVPLAVFGVFFYAVITGLALFAFVSKQVRIAPLMLFFTVPGFLLSLYFLYLQAAIIHAYCEYCLFSLFDATVLFLLSLYLYRKERHTAVPHQAVVQ